MSECKNHPGRAAAGQCEYCAGAVCAECRTHFNGRDYCPACYRQVAAFAGGVIKRVDEPAPSAIRVSGGPAADPTFPAPVSLGIYLFGFVIAIMRVGGLLLLLPAIFLLMADRQIPLQEAIGAFLTAGDSGLNLRVWTLSFGIRAWGLMLLTLGFTALMALFVERRSFRSYGWFRTGRVERDAALGLLLPTVLFATIVGVGAITGLYDLRAYAPLPRALLILASGLLVFIPMAVIEEVVCRGYVYAVAERAWGPVGAFITSCAVFSLLHSWNPGIDQHPLGYVGIALAGAYLTLAYRLTGRLWLPIFLHAGLNLMEGPVFGLPVSGMGAPESVMRAAPVGPELWTGGNFGPEAGLLLCIVLSVHTGVLILFARWVAREKDPIPPPKMQPELARTA